MTDVRASRVRVAAVHLRALPLEVVFADAPPAPRAPPAPPGPDAEDEPRSEAHPEEAAPGAGLGPCAVREMVRGRAVLVAVSEVASRAGVRPGMTEAEGRATLAGLAVRDREPSLELVHLERAAELLFAYGPEVEVCPPSSVYVELGRSQSVLRKRFGRVSEQQLLEHLVGDLRSIGHLATAALADDPDTARTFAEHLARQARARARPPPPEPRRPARRKTKPPAAKRRTGASSSSGPPSDPQGPVPQGPACQGSSEAPPAVFVVPLGRARACLGPLPVDALTWTDRAADPEGHLRKRLLAATEALRHLGVRDVAGLLRLPSQELGSRFGEAGVHLAERARGTRRRPLRRYVPPERLEESFELEAVTEALEPILFIIRRLLHRLEARLSARQRAAAGLTLDFLVEPGLERAVALDAARAKSSKQRETLPIRLARPTRSAEAMFAIVREKIGGALPGAVLAMRVVAEQPESDRGAQLDLFSRRAQKAEALGELVGRLGAALGDAAVFSPVLVDTHRPEAAWRPARFSVDAALAPVRPPPRAAPASFTPKVVASGALDDRTLPEVDARLSVVSPDVVRDPEADAQLEAWPKPRPRRPEDEPPPPLPPRPMELLETPEPATFYDRRETLAWRGRRLALRSVSGREHLATEWWRPDPLERDYLTVQTDDGRSLWVYVTPSGSTFVHGIFD